MARLQTLPASSAPYPTTQKRASSAVARASHVLLSSAVGVSHVLLSPQSVQVTSSYRCQSRPLILRGRCNFTSSYPPRSVQVTSSYPSRSVQVTFACREQTVVFDGMSADLLGFP